MTTLPDLGSPSEPARDDGVRRASRLRWLFVLPFVATLGVPIYNRVEPIVGAVPFFYWYQLLWVILTGVIIGIVYRAERHED